jgi:hypothetical protein
VREKATWYTNTMQSLAVIPHNIWTTDMSTFSDHVAGTKSSEHIKTIIKETHYLLQQLFNPDKTGLKLKYEMQAATAPHKESYMDTQETEVQLNITSIFVKYIASLLTKCFISSDYCDNFAERGGTVVKVLCYESEGCWFDSRWCHWNSSLT